MESQNLAEQNDVVCKYCQSQNVRKFGKYKDTQLYFCNVCERKFTPNASLFHMKTPLPKSQPPSICTTRASASTRYVSTFKPSTVTPRLAQSCSAG